MALNLLETLLQHKPQYVLMDAAQDKLVLAFLTQGKADWRSLYEGDTAYRLAPQAPYLVAVPESADWVEELLNKGWGRSWFVLLYSAASIEEVRRHLRRFLYVQDAQGKQLYFRFYDPRVLRAFLPACTSSELSEFFGPIRQFVTEGDEPDELCVLRLEPRGLVNRTAKVEELKADSV